MQISKINIVKFLACLWKRTNWDILRGLTFHSAMVCLHRNVWETFRTFTSLGTIFSSCSPLHIPFSWRRNTHTYRCLLFTATETKATFILGCKYHDYTILVQWYWGYHCPKPSCFMTVHCLVGHKYFRCCFPDEWFLKFLLFLTIYTLNMEELACPWNDRQC